MGRGKGARLSARMDVEVFRRLDRRSGTGPASKSSLAERYIDEGMRMEDHPGIVFRDGPAGRRASLTRGPDVWEVIAVVRDQPSSGDPALEGAAEWLDLPVADKLPSREGPARRDAQPGDC